MRRFGSDLAKLRKAEEEAVVSEISAVTQGPPENLSNADAALFCKLQNQLDDIYKCKAEGSFVRYLEGDGWSKENTILPTSSG